MRDTLLLRPDKDSLETWHWLRVDEAGQPRSEPGRGPLEAAAAVAGNARAMILAPGIDCLLTRVKLPSGSRQKLLRATPYALEEQLSDEVENLHFALGPAQAEGGCPVAVISIKRMDSLLEAVRSAGLEIQQMIPELLAVPYETDTTSVVLDQGTALVRTGAYSGFAVDVDNLGFVLAGMQDSGEPGSGSLRIHVDTASGWPELGEFGTQAQIETHEDDAILRLAAGLVSPNINLLQGAYSRSQEWGRLWRPWRATAALLLAGILISYLAAGNEYFHLGKERDALNAQLEQIYRETFPDAKRVVNARVQMQQQLDQLLRRQGRGAGFVTLLARSGDVLRKTQDVEVTGANFHAGRLDLDLTAGNLQVLDELERALTETGEMSVEIHSATADAGQRVQGRLRIQGAGL